MPSIVTIRTFVTGCFIFSALWIHAQPADSLACEKDYTDIASLTYKVSLRREVTGTFPVMQGDSVRYSVFKQKRHRASFSIVDSQGKGVPTVGLGLSSIIGSQGKGVLKGGLDPASMIESQGKGALTAAINSAVTSGRIQSVSPGNYFFKLKSKNLLPNTFIVTIQKKNCAYVKKRPVKPPPVLPDSITETIVTVKFDSSVYLASKLNLKNKQSLSIPVDSLQGVVVYEIRSSGGPVKYNFLNSHEREAKGKGEYCTGKLTAQASSYSLFIENEDKVVGKHVHINIRQVRYNRIPKPQ